MSSAFHDDGSQLRGHGSTVTRVAAPREQYNEDDAEHRQLRRVRGPLPWLLFAVCVLEMGERFVYIGLSGPLQNYIQIPYPSSNGVPGALGRGQSTGAALGNFFKFWAYLCTVFGAIVADQYLGKFKTIICSVPIYVIGMVILVATSTPAGITSGAAMGGLIAMMILVGLGTGGLKSCIAPLSAEQNTSFKSYIKMTKSGERVVVDAQLTNASIFMWYYWAANVGSLASLITTSVEKAHSFWVAYLIPLVVFLMTFGVFMFFSRRLTTAPAQGSAIIDAFKTTAIAIRERGFENAKPSALAARRRLEKYAFARANDRYTDSYVSEIRSGIGACKYFVLFPVYFVVWIQAFSNLVAQAGSMKLGGTPNDLMQSLETIFMLAFIPLLDIIIYPFLRKQWGIHLNPILRIFLGFIMAALAMTYCCVLQHFIYASPEENSIDVWLQTPAWIFMALSEIWVVVTGLEVAFLKAPESLRAFISSMFWLTIAFGAAVGIGLSPVSKDPYMVWLYGGIAVAAFVSGVLFYLWFRNDIANGIVPAGEVSALTGVEVEKVKGIEAGKVSVGGDKPPLAA
ncbi:POT family-domain-containing protein [Microdochium trichocladiopsis]|uniref:POT family-domain-containing protein n=1 Tax=Microdochium trichocladiopsis TaxID=1682393 RepID=A0A9P9BKZ2_9PEZI|nr:POT family-domain-containing protein [Microdochium trichocladiopsis]KAH7024402.1 POT family-domain-containing protein [Microdochium trichocladiopsis]